LGALKMMLPRDQQRVLVLCCAVLALLLIVAHWLGWTR
jgi:hypothetical protein